MKNRFRDMRARIVANLSAKVSNSNPEGVNQYSGASGIHKAYETAHEGHTEEQKSQVHAAIDSASKKELTEAFSKMGMKPIAGENRDKLAARVKRTYDNREGSRVSMSIMNRGKPKLSDLLRGN